MADLYGTSDRSSSLESEDMSLLQNLLHNNNSFPSLPSSCASFKDKHKQSFSSPPPPPPVDTSSSTANLFRRLPVISHSDRRFREGTSTAGSSVMVDSATGFNFRSTDAEQRTRNRFYSVCAVDSNGITSTLKSVENDVDDFGFDCQKGAEASEVPVNPALPRSSKRSRAAEFHNLSEKRRRSRINEKMKALQQLIPNSNKTDKASMLDEAIDYLKQLQQQVQMLSMRNGLNMQPFYLLGSVHPTQLPQTGIGFGEGNELLDSKGGEDTFAGKQEISMQAAFDLPNQCRPSNQPNLISPMMNVTNPETSYDLEPSIQNLYGPLNYLTSSKEICPEHRLSQLQLGASCFGKKSSGVSS